MWVQESHAAYAEICFILIKFAFNAPAATPSGGRNVNYIIAKNGADAEKMINALWTSYNILVSDIPWSHIRLWNIKRRLLDFSQRCILFTNGNRYLEKFYDESFIVVDKGTITQAPVFMYLRLEPIIIKSGHAEDAQVWSVQLPRP